jgi:NADH-quinone oxidoreductase subunit C
MNFQEIVTEIQTSLGSEILIEIHGDVRQPFCTVRAESLFSLVAFLKDTEGLYFDYLACITGLDNGVKDGSLEVLYHLNSLVYEHVFIIQVRLDRSEEKPTVPSLVPLWKGADWLERETFDMFGIYFSNHPRLKRLLLPTDWEGHPLRKDYEEQEYYHGITVKY